MVVVLRRLGPLVLGNYLAASASNQRPPPPQQRLSRIQARRPVLLVEELLKEGVDVNSIDLDGRTALHIASCEGHLEVVKLLLRYRANVNARDLSGSTPTTDAKFMVIMMYMGY